MNKLNRKIEYSLMALKHMSSKTPGELTTAKEVSQFYQAPFDATARVLQIMAQKGLLKAEHGVSGGYQITKDLAKVSFYDLVDMILGPNEIAKCLHKNEKCEIKSTCNIVSPVTQLNVKLNDFYKNLNLRELLGR